MKTCDEFTPYLAAYADGELEGDLRERVHRHVAQCPACRGESLALAKVTAVYRKVSPAEPSDAEWTTISSAIDGALDRSAATRPVPVGAVSRAEPRPRRAGMRTRPHWWVYASAALAAAAVLVVVLARPWDGTGPTLTKPTSPTTAQVDSVETPDPDYMAMVRLPHDKDGLMVVDVVRVE